MSQTIPFSVSNFFSFLSKEGEWGKQINFKITQFIKSKRDALKYDNRVLTSKVTKAKSNLFWSQKTDVAERAASNFVRETYQRQFQNNFNFQFSSGIFFSAVIFFCSLFGREGVMFHSFGVVVSDVISEQHMVPCGGLLVSELQE